MADRVTDAVSGANHWEQKSTNVSMEQLAADVREALSAQSG